MLIDQVLVTVAFGGGFLSWSTGFIPAKQSLYDELRKCPEAVFNLLCNKGEWELAEWVMDNFL